MDNERCTTDAAQPITSSGICDDCKPKQIIKTVCSKCGCVISQKLATPRPLPSDEGELTEKPNPKNGDKGGGIIRK